MRRFKSFKNFMRLDKKDTNSNFINYTYWACNIVNSVLNMGASGGSK